MKLKYDINAFCMVEELSGYQSLNDLLASETALASVRILRIMIYAGLLHSNKKLTLAAAGSILQKELDSGKTVDEIADEITDAIYASGLIENPENSEDEEDGEESDPKSQ